MRSGILFENCRYAPAPRAGGRAHLLLPVAQSFLQGLRGRSGIRGGGALGALGLALGPQLLQPLLFLRLQELRGTQMRDERRPAAPRAVRTAAPPTGAAVRGTRIVGGKAHTDRTDLASARRGREGGSDSASPSGSHKTSALQAASGVLRVGEPQRHACACAQVQHANGHT